MSTRAEASKPRRVFFYAMNHELETFQELRQINAKLSRLMVLVAVISILFVVPACLVIIWIGLNLAGLAVELSKAF